MEQPTDLVINFYQIMRESEPVVNPRGEEVWTGKGWTKSKRSINVAVVRLQKGKSSELHYHKKAVEIYILHEGLAHMEIDDDENMQLQGQAIVIIPPLVKHRIWNPYQKNAILSVVSSPAWDPSDNFVVKK